MHMTTARHDTSAIVKFKVRKFLRRTGIDETGGTHDASARDACIRRSKICCKAEPLDLRGVKCGRSNRIRLNHRHPDPKSHSYHRKFFFLEVFAVTFFEFKHRHCSCMASNQQQGGALPSSQGGLVQYFDADSGFKIDPKTVIMAGALVSVVELVLHTGILPV